MLARAWPALALGVLGSALLGCSGQAGDLFPGGLDSSANRGGGGGQGAGEGPARGGAGVDGAGSSFAGDGGAGTNIGTAGTSGATLGNGRGGSDSGPGGDDPGGDGSGSGSGSGGSGPTPVAGEGDGLGSGDDDAGVTPGEPEACDPCPCSEGPFGEPEPVLGLDLALPTFGPAPSADGLTLLFSAIGETEDIFFATRTNRGRRFSASALVPGLSTDATEEGTPFLLADASEVYFFSTRPGPDAVGERDLWVAAAEGDGFGEPTVVPRVNHDGLDHLPRLSPDGLKLAFVSGRDASALASNIWIAERSSRDAAFGEPVELPGVNTDAREEGFWLSPDGLTLFFASNRVAGNDMDIFVAVRPDPDGAFEEAQNLSVVNTPGIEIDPALTSDGFELFFASDRSGTMQLYRSARRCP